MKRNQTLRRNKKLICDWIDKKNYLIHYRMSEFYVKQRVIVDKVHESISFVKDKWLENPISFRTQRRSEAANGLEKHFYKQMNNAFDRKTMENVRNRIEKKFIRKDDEETVIKKQSKVTFTGVHKSYAIYDSFFGKKSDVAMNKPF